MTKNLKTELDKIIAEWNEARLSDEGDSSFAFMCRISSLLEKY